MTSITAKIASILDVISKGRLEFFFEMGHRGTRAESEAYAFEFMEDPERLVDFEEAVQIIKMMWTEGASSFDGKHNSIDGAVNHPLPVQQPHPPLWIGTLGTELSSAIAPNEQVLEIAAKYADGWNSTPVSPKQCRLMLDGLRKACERNGRDLGSMNKPVETQVMVAPARGDVEWLRDKISKRNPSLYDDAGWKQAEEQYLIGDPETVIARISEYQSIGIDYTQLWFMDMPSEQGLRTFAESLVPAFSER
jgi:alkanesulfonate monooxygenase SsuD/methylene tetrahydromethanopterin reductase-like flavin-dependent oxidoreductase (luciferase family)